jgi:STE24 endopeptidase
MAHEIGHYALGHVYEMIVSFGVVTAVSFMLANVGFAVLHSAFGAWWGVRDISDPAGFPILMIVLSMLGLVFTPITNTIIRTNEAEADIFGLNAAREPDGFATTALKLSEYRKLDPSPLEEVIFFDHPSGRSRIAMAMRWKAENFTDGAQKSAPDVVPSDPKRVPGVSPSDQPN